MTGQGVTVEDLERLPGMGRLEQAAVIGQQRLRLRSIPEGLLGAAHFGLAVGVGLPTCELLRVVRKDNHDVYLDRALTFAHTTDEPYAWLHKAEVPITWFGAIADGDGSSTGAGVGTDNLPMANAAVLQVSLAGADLIVPKLYPGRCFSLSSRLELRSGMTIRGSGWLHNYSSGNWLVKAVLGLGDIGAYNEDRTWYDMDPTVPEGTSKIYFRVAAEAGNFSVGSTFLIESYTQSLGQSQGGGGMPLYAEGGQVIEVDPALGYIITKHALCFTYTSAALNYSRICNVTALVVNDVTIRDLTLTQNQIANTFGFAIFGSGIGWVVNGVKIPKAAKGPGGNMICRAEFRGLEIVYQNNPCDFAYGSVGILWSYCHSARRASLDGDSIVHSGSNGLQFHEAGGFHTVEYSLQDNKGVGNSGLTFYQSHHSLAYRNEIANPVAYGLFASLGDQQGIRWLYNNIHGHQLHGIYDGTVGALILGNKIGPTTGIAGGTGYAIKIAGTAVGYRVLANDLGIEGARTYQDAINVVAPATGTSEHNNWYPPTGVSSNVVTKEIVKSGIVDNVATEIFKITTTNEAGNLDGGTYVCRVRGVITHSQDAAPQNSAYIAGRNFAAHFSRAVMNDGSTGVLSAVVEEYDDCNVATWATGRDIVTAVMTVAESSEFDVRVSMQIDISGTVLDAAQVAFLVEVIFFGFITTPVVAAV